MPIGAQFERNLIIFRNLDYICIVLKKFNHFSQFRLSMHCFRKIYHVKGKNLIAAIFAVDRAQFLTSEV